MTRRALTAFQADQHLSVDGLFGPQTWAALVRTDLAGQSDPQPYTNVAANLDLPQTLTVYADGRPVPTSRSTPASPVPAPPPALTQSLNG